MTDFDVNVVGQRFVLEDDGFSSLLLNAARAKLRSRWFSPSLTIAAIAERAAHLMVEDGRHAE